MFGSISKGRKEKENLQGFYLLIYIQIPPRLKQHTYLSIFLCISVRPSIHPFISLTMLSLLHLLLSIFLSFPALIPAQSTSPPPPPHLNLTSITVDTQTRSSIFQCWSLSAPVVTTNAAGRVPVQALAMGELGNSTYTVIPGGTDAGVHVAPAAQ